jgi:hypothetical protein
MASALVMLGHGVSLPARPVCVRFVVCKVALRRVSLHVFFLSHVSNIPPAFHTHSDIYFRRHLFLPSDSVAKIIFHKREIGKLFD